MKFKSDVDKELCLLELLSHGINVGEEVTTSTFERPDVKSFLLHKRVNSVNKLKDFRRSQSAKGAWRGGRYRYLKGIRRFARSVEGKRVKRSLARYLVSRGILRGPREPKFQDVSTRLRETSDYLNVNPNASIFKFDLPEFVVALSSCQTHLLIETKYWMSTVDEVDYLESLEIVLPHLQDLLSRAQKALVDYEDLKLEEGDVYLIDSLIGDLTEEDFASLEESDLS
jgi:hypothetical protein